MDKQYVVCVLVNGHTPHPDSIPRRCDICFGNVWCMPHNLTKTPVCLNCCNKLPDPHFILTKENFVTAMEEIRRRMTEGHDGT